MLNQVVMVGRLTSDLEIKEVEGKNVCNLTIAIPRSYKNAEGEYETDFISARLLNSIAEQTAEYCKKGDIIGIKGRLESAQTDDKKGYHTEVIAEKVTFLSSNSKGE